MPASKKFYITTAITYANSRPHIGHAYEEIATDVLARWWRMNIGPAGVRFATGSDEHSANVEARARELKISPQKYCDQMADIFQNTWKALNISYDRFIRTSEPIHHRAAQEIVRRARAAGDIYPGHYTGWYCNSCENYYQPTELKEGLCPIHGIQPVWLSEANYFFRLSRFADLLLNHIETHAEFIQPEARRNEIINLIKAGLKDISISRTSTQWGIPFPDDPQQIIYVWFDALINYISAVGFPDDEEMFNRYWPADLHVIGKDITRFHCIIWPAMLMSAKLPLPRRVFSHGFIYWKGEKISKTRGNILDPLELVQVYGVDAFRYVLLATNVFSGDGDFSEEGMVERYNTDLANDLGNLLSRTLSMVEKYCAGQIPAAAATSQDLDQVLPQMAAALFSLYAPAIEELNFSKALAAVWDLVKRANKYIEESAPWALFKQGKTTKLNTVIYNLLEVLRLVAAYLYPFMPMTTPRILTQLGDHEPGRALSFPAEAKWGRLSTGQVIAKGGPLFPRIEKEKSENV